MLLILLKDKHLTRGNEKVELIRNPLLVNMLVSSGL